VTGSPLLVRSLAPLRPTPCAYRLLKGCAVRIPPCEHVARAGRVGRSDRHAPGACRREGERDGCGNDADDRNERTHNPSLKRDSADLTIGWLWLSFKGPGGGTPMQEPSSPAPLDLRNVRPRRQTLFRPCPRRPGREARPGWRGEDEDLVHPVPPRRVSRVRGVALVLGAAVLLAGCVHDEPSREVPDPFTVTVSEDAASAAHAAGVDLERLAVRSARRAFELLPHRGKIRIGVALDGVWSIPEIGVGGVTHRRTGDVLVSIDDAPPGGLKAALETWLPAILAHELHHSSRVRMGPGYGITLAEALVTEGLADHFAAEAFPDTPLQPWDNALSADREAELWRKAQSVLEEPYGYNHRAWFFGSGDLPRWAGYTLGYRIAEAYLGDDLSASNAAGTEAQTVIERYVSTR
jgi:hypothetical protein